MKALALYSLAAALYVVGGVFMKYSAGLTRWLPALALVVVFGAGALDASLGDETGTIGIELCCRAGA